MKFENVVTNDESSFPYDDALDFFHNSGTDGHNSKCTCTHQGTGVLEHVEVFRERMSHFFENVRKFNVRTYLDGDSQFLLIKRKHL